MSERDGGVNQDAIDARDEAEQFNVWLTNRLRSSLTKSEEAELASRFHGHRAAQLAALRDENGRLSELLAAHTSWKPGIGIQAHVKACHGVCCCCATCGHWHDDCVCEHNEIEQALAHDASKE